MIKLYSRLHILIATILLVLSCSVSAMELPNPTDYYDGLPSAILYDQIYSYNLNLLDSWVDAGLIEDTGENYAANAGLGNQDIVLYTQANGTDNIGIGADGYSFDFEEPVNTNTGSESADGSTFNGTWGQNDQNNDGIIENNIGPTTTVGTLLAYLQSFNADNDIPVFLFDLNQTGAANYLWASGQVYILDDLTGDLVDSWAFDTISNGTFDAPVQNIDGSFAIDNMVYAPGAVEYTGLSGTSYDASAGGSGSYDYALFSPDMALSNYDPSDLFVVEFYFEGLNNGGEEIFITGATSPSVTVVPEPSSLLLLGMGMVGVGVLVRKRKL